MSKDKDALNNFYAVLPYIHGAITEYPADIEILHAYEEPPTAKGLSSEQVSALARDGLNSSTISPEKYS